MESTLGIGTRVGGRQRVSRLLSPLASPLDKALFNRLANHLSKEEQSHKTYPTWASHYIAFVEILRVCRAHHAEGQPGADTEQDTTTNRLRRTWFQHSNTVGSIQRPYVPRSLATVILCRALVGLFDDERTEYRSGNLAEYVMMRVSICPFLNFMCDHSLGRCKTLSMFSRQQKMQFRTRGE